jgi:diguanylate cyclase (GGDEF)-like protein
MGAEIYRYNEDEFVLIFYNEDKKKSFEYLENIRRSIASSEFVINSKQSVRMTISSGVSEKKRSDADADAVLLRAREAFQKTYKFTQNVTSMA